MSLDRRWSLPQLEDFIYQCYPQHPLQLVGFQYAKCLKGAKRELQIVNSNNVTDLASTIRAGKVYIVPNREIPATQVITFMNFLCHFILTSNIDEPFLQLMIEEIIHF